MQWRLIAHRRQAGRNTYAQCCGSSLYSLELEVAKATAEFERARGGRTGRTDDVPVCAPGYVSALYEAAVLRDVSVWDVGVELRLSE